MGEAGAEPGAYVAPREPDSRPVDARIALVAARQAGIISHAQLLALPLSRGAIRKRIAAGRLHPVFPGAYAVGVPATRTEAIRVAALLSTAPSFVSNRDAMEHYGVWAPIPGPVHVTVAHGRRLRRDGIVIHRTRHLPAEERRVRGAMRLTSPARTLVDIAAGVSERRLTAAFDEARRRLGLVDAGEVIAACVRSARRAGTGRLIALAGEPHLPFERTRSRSERRFLRFCADSGLPVPLVNVPLVGYEVDFLWPQSRLVVEIDGPHHDGPRSRADDDARDGRLAAVGFRVERIPVRRLDAPGALAYELRALIA